mgnify:CR=1 FL=1
MANYFNITGELTQELIPSGNNLSLSKISLTNTDPTHTGIVDLYMEKKLTGKFYLLKNVNIPPGVTLVHDIMYGANGFSLYIKLTKTTTTTLTGSIDPAASTTVPGSGTAFLSEVSIGDELVVSGETRIVTAIASDTSLTVGSAFSDNSNDTSPDINPVAPIDVILF